MTQIFTFSSVFHNITTDSSNRYISQFIVHVFSNDIKCKYDIEYYIPEILVEGDGVVMNQLS